MNPESGSGERSAVALKRTSIAWRSLGAALAWTLLVGCADLLVDSYRFGRVEVIARTRLGAPVEGVDLLLYRGEVHLGYGMTDSNGNAVFEHVPFGNLGLLAMLPENHSSLDFSQSVVVDGIQVDEGSDRTVPLELMHCNSTMSISVLDDLGSPVAGTSALVYRSDGVYRIGTTDADGRAVIADLPCGNLGVSITPPDGYLTVPGRGGSYLDGIVSRGEEEIPVEFTVLRT